MQWKREYITADTNSNVPTPAIAVIIVIVAVITVVNSNSNNYSNYGNITSIWNTIYGKGNIRVSINRPGL